MKTTDLQHGPDLGRRILSKLLFVSTALLILLGGMVTSLNVGLSVPDWPTSFGYQMWNMPFRMWHGGALYEHSHRVFASGIGLIVLALTIWVLLKERRAWVRYLSAAALVMVVVQGILGGLTVRLQLPTIVSVSHGVLAQTFLLVTVALAYAHSKEYVARVRDADGGTASTALRRATLVLLVLVYLQLIIGAVMRHEMKHIGGVAIHDFPTVAGDWVPRFTQETLDTINLHRDSLSAAGEPIAEHVSMVQVLIHFVHRLGALAIVLAAGVLTFIARRIANLDRRVFAGVYLLDSVLVIQIMLGILTVWTQKGEIITSLHVVNGALMLSACMLLALRIWPVRTRDLGDWV